MTLQDRSLGSNFRVAVAEVLPKRLHSTVRPEGYRCPMWSLVLEQRTSNEDQLAVFGRLLNARIWLNLYPGNSDPLSTTKGELPSSKTQLCIANLYEVSTPKADQCPFRNSVSDVKRAKAQGEL